MGIATTLRRAFDRSQVRLFACAWSAPRILAWPEWVAARIAQATDAQDAVGEADFLLSDAQELALWTSVIEDCAATISSPSPAALASLVRDAWRVHQLYEIPESALARQAQNVEQRAYLAWSGAFRARCRDLRVIDLASAVRRLSPECAEAAARSVGFFANPPALARVLPPALPPAVRGTTSLVYRVYPDLEQELAAAVAWCRAELADGMEAAIVCADELLHEQLATVADRTNRTSLIEVLRAPTVRAAGRRAPSPLVVTALHLVSLVGEVSRASAAALLTSPYLVMAEHEIAPRARAAARVLRSGVEPIAWRALAEIAHDAQCVALEPLWQMYARLEGERGARELKQWLARLENLLHAAGWPGDSALADTEQEILRRWQRMLDTVASLDAVVPPGSLQQAIQRVRQQAATINGNATPSLEALEILSLDEAATVQTPCWIVGLHAQSWPPPTEPNPFLPFELQRAVGVPAAQRVAAGAVAAGLWQAILGGADRCYASYTEQVNGVPQCSIFGYSPQQMELAHADSMATTALETRPDAAVPLLTAERIKGGAAVLTDQSACAFRAFARHRLHARGTEAGELGIDARQRGDLVHRVLGAFWQQVRTRERALALGEDGRMACLTAMARDVCASLSPARPGSALEEERLVSLASEWLACDLARADFEVIQVEAPRRLELLPLTLDLRIDRIDRIGERTVLIDYKTGNRLTRGQWETPRPEQPQLPAYALAEPTARGIAFAQVRRGGCKYLELPKKSLDAPPPDDAEWAALVVEWERELSRLAQDFASGTAPLNPLFGAQTCRVCDLQTLCRVHEQGIEESDDDE